MIVTQISFIHDDSSRDLLGFDRVLIYKKHKLSQNPVDILTFDNISLEEDVAHGLIFKGKRSGIIPKLTMDVDPDYENIENFRGGVQLYMMQSKILIQVIALN